MPYDKEKHKTAVKRWAASNPDKMKEYRQRHEQKNKEAILEKARKYRAENREKVNKRNAEYRKTPEFAAWMAQYKERTALERKAYEDEYYEKNKQKILEKSREWYAANKERCAAVRKAALPVDILYRRAKWRAKELNVPFTITKSDVVIPDVCPYLKVPMVRGNLSPEIASYSLDRKVPSLGYVPGNIEVISYAANIIKWKFTTEELAWMLPKMAEEILYRNSNNQGTER